MARMISQLLALISKRTCPGQTGCSDFYNCIVWMLDLWCRYFFNADLEGLFIMDRFHGGCSCRHVVICPGNVEFADETSLWYI